MKCLLLVLALAAGASAGVTNKAHQVSSAADYFHEPCRRNAPSEELNACIRKNVQFAIPHFTFGSKLFELEQLDPLEVNDIRINLNREPFNFIAVARNMKVHGVSDINVQEVRATLSDDSVNIDIDVFFPKFVAEGDFKIDGKFGNFPFAGKGPYNVSITDLYITWRLQGNVIEKDGEKYINIKRFSPDDYKIGSMKSWAENLVAGAPELTNLAMTLVNQFWETGFQVLVPVVNPEVEQFLRTKANKVFSRVPYENLFPVA